MASAATERHRAPGATGSAARNEEAARSVRKSSGSPASDDDTTDIPLDKTNTGDRSSADRKGRAGSGGENASGAGRAEGVWSSVRGRIGGRGPLSPEREERAEKDQANEQAAQAVEPGGSMDPNVRMKRLSSSIQSGEHEPDTAAEEEEDDGEGLAGSGPLLWFIDHWIPITVPLVLLCIGVFVFATVFTSGPSGEELASSKGGSGGSKSESSNESGGGGDGGSQEQVPLYDSGLAFEYSQQDGKARLTAGDLTWEGEVERGEGEDPRETITLAGPTAAKINRGYQMEGDSAGPGEVETMTYAVEAEDAPDIHATYQRFSGASSDGPVEAPNGAYSITEDSGNLIAEGTYSDKRTGDGDEVIRTYTETIPGSEEPQQFRVRYEAPPETPIPALVGWQDPEVRAEGESQG